MQFSDKYVITAGLSVVEYEPLEISHLQNAVTMFSISHNYIYMFTKNARSCQHSVSRCPGFQLLKKISAIYIIKFDLPGLFVFAMFVFMFSHLKPLGHRVRKRMHQVETTSGLFTLVCAFVLQVG